MTSPAPVQTEGAPAPVPATMQGNAPPVPANVLTEWSPPQVRAQLDAITELMRDCMKEGEDFGIIPGCKKPSLLKPGAEKLGLMFRLAPSYQIITNNFDHGHREVVITCVFTHIPTGTVMGSGVGSCSTMESKYRWRGGKNPDEVTDTAVPKKYWERRRAEATPAELQGILAEAMGEPGKYGTKKVDDLWLISKRGESTGEREENPDIADTYNTVLKMAKKRAQVDAALTVTAASQIFTQDVEEMGGAGAEDAESKPVQPSNPVSTAPEESAEAKDVRKRANVCNTIASLSVVKQACRDSGGAWWTKEINDILNARYKAITGENPPADQGGAK
jgi:hypothetical protein